ncbi:4Fe-4S binding protein [Candidatus Peregrinibacteria bacterium]|nr:4Fe-4S binding protein [Candidatus Peregrinibacteria bacterium]
MMTLPHLEISNRCIQCDNCRLICPDNAIIMHNQEYYISVHACTLCMICTEICPTDCIKQRTPSRDEQSTETEV